MHRSDATSAAGRKTVGYPDFESAQGTRRRSNPSSMSFELVGGRFDNITYKGHGSDCSGIWILDAKRMSLDEASPPTRTNRSLAIVEESTADRG